jgi:FAD:protein FMN transferase
MKQVVSFLILFFSITSFGQIIHKRKLAMLGSPFEITVVAKILFKEMYTLI